MKYLTKEAVFNLIPSNGFGCFYLHDAHSGEYLGGSHTNSEEGAATVYKPEEIAQSLGNLLDHLGDGHYKVRLKAKYKTPAQSEAIYRFKVGSEAQAQPATASGFGYAEHKEEISRAVTEAVAREREKFEQEKRFYALETELRMLREQKAQPSNAMNEGLTDLAKMFGVLMLGKVAPEALPVLNKMLGEMEAGEDETPAPAAPQKRFD
jgi:hypothetical protein